MINQQSNNSLLIKQVYRKTKLIQKNQTKTIWQVTHIYTGDVVVAKTQPLTENITNQRTILHEGKFLQSCQGAPGIPFLIWCGKDQVQKLGILIEQKLGKTLKQLYTQQLIYSHKNPIKSKIINHIKHSQSIFSLKTIVMIGLQLIKIISCYHEKGYIHRNINLDTLQFGCGTRCDKLYFNDLIDSRSFYKKNTLQHIDKKASIKLKKINQFMSSDVLNGVQPSRKDDMESIMLILLYLSRGSLPWIQLFKKNEKNTASQITNRYSLKQNQDTFQQQGPTELRNFPTNLTSISSKHSLAQKISSYLNGTYGEYKIQKKAQLIRQIRSQTDFHNIFSSLPRQFYEIFCDITKLQFKERPNYLFYIQKLQAVLIKQDLSNDHIYDWMCHSRLNRPESKGGLGVQDLKWLIYKGKDKNSGEKDNSFNKLPKLDNEDQILKIYEKYAPYIEIDKLGGM